MRLITKEDWENGFNFPMVTDLKEVESFFEEIGLPLSLDTKRKIEELTKKEG